MKCFFYHSKINARQMTAGVGIFKGGDMSKIRKVNLDKRALYYRIFKSPQPLNGVLLVRFLSLLTENEHNKLTVKSKFEKNTSSERLYHGASGGV